VIKYDEALNKSNKDFVKFCNEYKQDRLNTLAGAEKHPDAPDSMTSVIAAKTQQRVFGDLQKNMGNEVIRCVASANKNNRKNKKASPTKTKLVRKACSGNVQKHFHSSYGSSRGHKNANALIVNLKPLDLTYLDIQMKKDRHRKTLEKLAKKRNMTVEELEKQLTAERGMVRVNV
jgi:hypothetical protein